MFTVFTSCMEKIVKISFCLLIYSQTNITHIPPSPPFNKQKTHNLTTLLLPIMSRYKGIGKHHKVVQVKIGIILGHIHMIIYSIICRKYTQIANVHLHMLLLCIILSIQSLIHKFSLHQSLILLTTLKKSKHSLINLYN